MSFSLFVFFPSITLLITMPLLGNRGWRVSDSQDSREQLAAAWLDHGGTKLRGWGEGRLPLCLLLTSFPGSWEQLAVDWLFSLLFNCISYVQKMGKYFENANWFWLLELSLINDCDVKMVRITNKETKNFVPTGSLASLNNGIMLSLKELNYVALLSYHCLVVANVIIKP